MKPDMMLVGKKLTHMGGVQLWFFLKSIPHYIALLNTLHVLIGEVKKSSKSEDSARFQLLFYMYELKKRGINANGVLLFPKEKKRIYVQLSEEDEKLLNELISSIIDTINKPYPPEGNHKRCGPCAYREFCLS